MCIDTKYKSSHSNFGLDLCTSSNKNVGGEQVFIIYGRTKKKYSQKKPIFFRFVFLFLLIKFKKKLIKNFELTWQSDLRPRGRDVCWDASRSEPGSPILLFECHGLRGNQEFRYNHKSMQILHAISNSCLDSNKERKEIFINKCDASLNSQKWQFEFYNKTLIERDFKF